MECSLNEVVFGRRQGSYIMSTASELEPGTHGMEVWKASLVFTNAGDRNEQKLKLLYL